MKELAWTPMLETGIPEIDQEHQQIFALYNRSIQGDVPVDKERLVEELIDYAATHFAHEEGLMLSVGYPLLECTEHFREHREFVTRVGELRRLPDYRVLDFIQEWLLRHIMVSDFLVAIHLHKLQADLKDGVVG